MAQQWMGRSQHASKPRSGKWKRDFKTEAGTFTLAAADADNRISVTFIILSNTDSKPHVVTVPQTIGGDADRITLYLPAYGGAAALNLTGAEMTLPTNTVLDWMLPAGEAWGSGRVYISVKYMVHV